MKLRNKKTGEIGEPRVVYQEIYVDTTEPKTYCYKSIAEFNEDWEDYRPQEPLIINEKIRKAVKAWAEANGASILSFDGGYILTDEQSNDIEFWANMPFERLEKGKEYTITELCGEEEECEN